MLLAGWVLSVWCYIVFENSWKVKSKQEPYKNQSYVIGSLCFTTENNIGLYVNYISNKKYQSYEAFSFCFPPLYSKGKI